MNDDGLTESFTQALWGQCLERMRESGNILDGAALADSPESAHEAVDYLFMTLSSAYVLMARSDPDYPEFLPFVNHIFPYAGANPDATYYYTSLSGSGTYRIVGHRNTVHWVDFLTGYDYVGFVKKSGKSFPSRNLDDFEINADGSFEFLLSNVRPDGYVGNWMKLEAEANHMVVRQFAYRPDEVDARMAIERVDKPALPKFHTAADASERIRKVMDHLHTSSMTWPKFLGRLKDKKVINRFQSITYDTGDAQGQIYQEGLYEIGLDQAMLIEVKVPTRCSYWNVQIADTLWRTMDWINRPNTLNGYKDRSDSDGVMRVVVAHRDPGIENWIDAAGVTEGELLWRWQGADSTPEPVVTVVDFDELDKCLPAHSKRIAPAQRAEALREWTIARQLRRSW